MTWDELAELIREMTLTQRQTDVTIYLDGDAMDEFLPITRLLFIKEENNDRLDTNHPYFEVQP